MKTLKGKKPNTKKADRDIQKHKFTEQMWSPNTSKIQPQKGLAAVVLG